MGQNVNWLGKCVVLKDCTPRRYIMYVSVYVSIYVRMYVCKYTCICMYVAVCMYYICTYACIYILSMYVCMHMYTLMYVCVGGSMALGSTQPLTEMSTRCISWG